MKERERRERERESVMRKFRLRDMKSTRTPAEPGVGSGHRGEVAKTVKHFKASFHLL